MHGAHCLSRVSSMHSYQTTRALFSQDQALAAVARVGSFGEARSEALQAAREPHRSILTIFSCFQPEQMQLFTKLQFRRGEELLKTHETGRFLDNNPVIGRNPPSYFLSTTWPLDLDEFSFQVGP